MRMRRDAGLTILELTIAIVVITVGLLTLIAVFPIAIRAIHTARETDIAYSSIRAKLDEMRSVPFYDPNNPTNPNIFSTYNGATFTAVGLLPPASGPTGQITFLTEAQANALWSIHCDFNLNGVNDETTTPTAQFACFPVKLEVNWTTPNNFQRGVTVTTIIYNDNH